MESVNWCPLHLKGLNHLEWISKVKSKKSFLRAQSLQTQFLFKHKGFRQLLPMKIPYCQEEFSSGRTLLSCFAVNPTQRQAILSILSTWSRNTQLPKNLPMMNKIIRKSMRVSEIVYIFSWSKRRAITFLMWAPMTTDKYLHLKSSQSSKRRQHWGERLICQKLSKTLFSRLNWCQIKSMKVMQTILEWKRKAQRLSIYSQKICKAITDHLQIRVTM